MISLNIIREPDQFCEPCGLYKHCKSPVMNGEGSESPTWMFVGEGPGAEEDEKGIPFCGESGVELRQGIEDVGIPIAKCRFSNAVRCRSPNNDLKKFSKAIDYCQPHILREIRATRPKVVVLIGNSAIKSLLNRTGILKLHGQVIDIGRLKFVCMFHPAYLLRNNTPNTRRLFLDALRVAKREASTKSISAKSDRIHTVIRDRKMLQEAVEVIKKTEYPATDIEGSTLSPFFKHRKPVIGVIGVANDDKHSFEFPIHVRTGLEGCNVSPTEMLEGVKEIWEDQNLKWCVWNGIYDIGYTGVLHDVWLGGKDNRAAYFDGMLASYALDERKGLHKLKLWSSRVNMPNYEQLLEQYKMVHPEAGQNYTLIPADILYPYNGDDCIATRRLFFLQRKKLKEEGLWNRPFKFPLMWIAWIAMMMQINGMKASEERNRELDSLYRKRISKLDDQLYSFPAVKELQKQEDEELMLEFYERVKAYKKSVPSVKKKVLDLFKNRKIEPVNLNSPDVKRKLIFDILNYESLAETKGKQPSVERWIVEELYKKHKDPLLGAIVKRSQYASAHSKYILPVISDWIGIDGRVHSSHLPHGTVTGRLSSEDPNLYNLPARSSLTEELMSQFVPRNENYVILKQDSKQIELRLIADRAKDKVMIAEFRAGKDPHAMGAQAAYEYTEEEWNRLAAKLRKKLRDICKNAVSFGLVYGRLAAALAADFGWSLRKAEDFIGRYFAKYHGIKAYLENERERILEECLSISHNNRHRRLPEAQSENIGIQNQAVREGINAPVQGDASDINIIAAYRMQKWLLKHHMKTKVINYAYDAVYTDCHRGELKAVSRKLHFFMTDRKFLEKMVGWKLNVPLDTDCAVGDQNMGAMIELEHTKIPGQFVIPKTLLHV